MEFLDQSIETPKWKKLELSLISKREKFAYTAVPRSQFEDCS